MKQTITSFKKPFAALAFAVLLFFAAGMQQVEAQTYNLINDQTTPQTVGTTNVTLLKTGTNTSGCIGKTSRVGANFPEANGTVTANFTGGTSVYTVYIAIDGLDYGSNGTVLDRALIAVNGNTITPVAANFLCNGGACSPPAANTYQFSNCGGADNLVISGNYLQSQVPPLPRNQAFAKGVYKISSCTPITSVSVTNEEIGSTGGFGLAMYIITGLSQPSLTLATAGTNNQTTTTGTAITPIVYNLVGASGATVTGLPAGVTGTYNAGAFTLIGTPTVAGTYNYTVNSVGPICSATGTITVNAPPPPCSITLATAGTNTQTKTVGTAITPIVYNLVAATGATISPALLPAGLVGTYNAGANTYTISGTPTAPTATPYNYTVTATGTTCTGVTATGTITVNAACNAGAAGPVLTKNP